MTADRPRLKWLTGPRCVGLGAFIGPVIAWFVGAGFFPDSSYERLLPWLLGAIPFGAFVGWLVSLRKRR
jgi:hypothetical protein